MNLKLLSVIAICAASQLSAMPQSTEYNLGKPAPDHYVPSPEIRKSQEDFSADRFGIFIHWGIYSMFARGEWYLQNGPLHSEYSKHARGFYPADFNAEEWVKAIKDAGAKYICFTTRHHDGFSMFHTAYSDYNIVDGTPFKRDILKELADACHKHDIKLHLYYSHVDWGRDDYPLGRTGLNTGRPTDRQNWNSYFSFMNNQLTELLSNYGPVRAVWFDGYWDHDEDKTPFDWHLPEQYALIHSLQPGCLIGNNHHLKPFDGEDIQIFERDLPGENTAGFSDKSEIGHLPLETCQTMNGMWGYKVQDTDYKDVKTLVRYLVKTAGMGANLLLNIGPQPNGELPAVSLERLKGMGEWLRTNGETIYGTQGAPFGKQAWGTATRKGSKLYLHVTNPSEAKIHVPYSGKVKGVRNFSDKTKLKYSKGEDCLTITLPSDVDPVDHIIEVDC